jgi:hypothetical protein
MNYNDVLFEIFITSPTSRTASSSGKAERAPTIDATDENGSGAVSDGSG